MSHSTKDYFDLKQKMNLFPEHHIVQCVTSGGRLLYIVWLAARALLHFVAFSRNLDIGIHCARGLDTCSKWFSPKSELVLNPSALAKLTLCLKTKLLKIHTEKIKSCTTKKFDTFCWTTIKSRHSSKKGGDLLSCNSICFVKII